jgi:UDP-2-acetamido-2,6-beta-L-arabino-hexul-4-ose reductase
MLELVYIDDLIDEIRNALTGNPHREGEGSPFCLVSVTHSATVGEIARLLESFRDRGQTPAVSAVPDGSLEKKLYATYLSYLPVDQAVRPLDRYKDARGSFTELIRTDLCGQVSVNTIRPGVTKGQHWHMTKHEIFTVVAGEGLIRMRRVDGDEALEVPVTGEKPEAVRILPGYVHSITNLSETADLVTVIWASECYDPSRPDTYPEEV